MFTKESIKEIIESYIEKTENLGDQTGGSGHMGFVSYNLVEYNSQELPGKKVEIIFKYVISVETEFTYYPDNPPMETEY